MRRARESAFTLIELLVVIAVIGILAALIMPAVLNALTQSQSANCKSNLHQIGNAFVNYVQYYKGLMPSHDDEPGLSFPVWNQKMWWRFAHGQLVPFVGEHGVYRCPADSGVNPELGARKWFSYTWNTRLGAYSHGSTQRFNHKNVADVKVPSRMIDFLDGAEGDGGTDGNNDRPYMLGGLPVSYGFRRHNDGFNALFIDGHVLHYKIGETDDENYDL
jgi:prepilin-type N-terminal cleavage/methylation domain-containing protein/prepilin-type processing-associated H-X9-DG protein